jgi:hypothetical protein
MRVGAITGPRGQVIRLSHHVGHQDRGKAALFFHSAGPRGGGTADALVPVSSCLQQDTGQPIRLVNHNSVAGCRVF